MRSSVCGVSASGNTMFPQLEDDECDWDAAGTPVRSTTYRAKAVPSMARMKNAGVLLS